MTALELSIENGMLKDKIKGYEEAIEKMKAEILVTQCTKSINIINIIDKYVGVENERTRFIG